MRLLNAHEARHASAEAPTRYYSLELPPWAACTAGGSVSASRAARQPSLTVQTLRRMRSHPTGSGR
jgi:hypothetical protein